MEAAIRRASRATGVDFDFLMKTARRESAMNPAAKARTALADSGTTGLWIFGIALLVLGLCQLAAGIQVLRDRIGVPVLVIVVLALAARVVGLILDGPSVIGAGQAALMALALALVWLARGRSVPTTT